MHCVFCDEKINDGDTVEVKGGKLYHKRCTQKEKYDEYMKEIDDIQKEFPTLTRDHIELIHDTYLDEFKYYDWFVLYNDQNKYTWYGKGFGTEKELVDNIKVALKDPKISVEMIAYKQKNVIFKIVEHIDVELKVDIEPTNKYEAWKEDYADWVDWQTFEEEYVWCNRCNSFQRGQCICYAR